MTEMIALEIYYYFIWYYVGGLATTDILRLIKGSYTSVLSDRCYCPGCGYEIPKRKQIPILTFLVNKGKCSKCSAKIPIISIVLELVIPIIAVLTRMILPISFKLFFVNIIVYELIKIAVIIIFGKREKNFIKNYLESIIANIAIFSTMLAGGGIIIASICFSQNI